MKKLVLLLGMFIMVSLTSCTDNTEENLINKTEKRNELIDKDKVETPTTKGKG